MKRFWLLVTLILFTLPAMAQKSPEEMEKWQKTINDSQQNLVLNCKNGNGDLYACAELGRRMLRQPKSEEKKAEARRLLKYACTADVAWACRDLGEALFDRQDYEKSLDEAIRPLLQSCELGVANACWLAGERLVTHYDNPEIKIRGLKALFKGCFNPAWIDLKSCASIGPMASRASTDPKVADYIKTVPGPVEVYGHACRPEHKGQDGLLDACTFTKLYCDNATQSLNCEYAEKVVRLNELEKKCRWSSVRKQCDEYLELKRELQ